MHAAALFEHTQPPGSVFALRGVDADLDATPVLRGVDLSAGEGEVIGVVGANGSGKSTLLRVLATLLVPCGGQGHVLGAPLGSRATTTVRRRIGLIGHVSALHPQLTLRENLRLTARLTGRSRDTVEQALDLVGLAAAADRRADRCSQGMRRRTEIARVLAAPPRLLLLDEVHTGLDTASAALVPGMVQEMRRAGGATVVVTHDHGLCTAVADRVVEVEAGRVQASSERADTERADTQRAGAGAS